MSEPPDLTEMQRADAAPRWMPLLIAAVGVVAYHNSLSVPFHFDDLEAIVQNSTIRSLADLGTVLRPPRETSVAGRPTVNLSLAINFALSGADPRSYHVVNLLVHVAAACALFAIVRRTLRMPALAARFGGAAGGLACAIAVLWVAHPLQTMSVTYVIQRAEAIMALCYLLTLYCVIRGAESRSLGPRAGPAPVGVGDGAVSDCGVEWANGTRQSLALPRSARAPGAEWADTAKTGAPSDGTMRWRRWAWNGGAIVSCALGMGAKEVMVTAPLVVLLYDRVFLAESFAELRRRRWGLYGGLAVTWAILAALLWQGPRSESAGFGLKEVGALAYLLTQPEVILHYLRLAFWPSPLCIDYDWQPVTSFTRAVQPVLAITIILFLSLRGLWRGRPAGFAASAFFIILAPTSSCIPIIIVASEHRMYLPLAIVIGLAVLGAYSILQPARPAAMRVASSGWRTVLGVGLAVGATVFLVRLTIERNKTYQSALALWSDTVRLRPDNARAVNSLGFALSHAGRFEEAVSKYRAALRLRPDYADAHFNLAEDLARLGRRDEAKQEYEAAITLRPHDAEALNGLAALHVAQGELSAAAEDYRRVLAIRPESTRALSGLGLILATQGLHDEAAALLRRAVAIDADNPEWHIQLGTILAAARRFADAAEPFSRAVQLQPDNHAARLRLAMVLTSAERRSEALAQFSHLLEAQPHAADVHVQYGVTLARSGDPSKAIPAFRRALKLQPEHAEALKELAWILATCPDDKLREAEEAVRLGESVCRLTNYKNFAALDTLAAAYAAAGRFDDARRVAEQALELASQAKQDVAAGKIRERLDHYRQNQAYRSQG